MHEVPRASRDLSGNRLWAALPTRSMTEQFDSVSIDNGNG